MSIKIRLAKKNEGYNMSLVIESAWMDTYPNKEHGISMRGIRNQFNEKRKKWGKPIVNNEESHSWVAVDGDRVVGVCRARLQEGKNYLGATYILKGYRGQGIGSKMLKKVINWYGRDVEIVTDVACYNESAINFYKKHGFVKYGRVRRPKGTTLPNGEVIPVFKMTRNKKD